MAVVCCRSRSLSVGCFVASIIEAAAAAAAVDGILLFFFCCGNNVNLGSDLIP